MKGIPFGVEVEFVAPYALFTDPVFKTGGEKVSYLWPVYGAIKGALGSTYKKPTFNWVVDEIRVMNEVRTESRGFTVPHYKGGQADLATYLYLKDVRYKVRAHIEWNTNPEFDRYAEDRIAKKHEEIFWRAVTKSGGRHRVTLGPSECVAEIRPTVFDEGVGYYDNSGHQELGCMEHCVLYSSEGYNAMTRENPITVHFWMATMDNGVIKFPRPDECTLVKPLIRKGAKE